MPNYDELFLAQYAGHRCQQSPRAFDAFRALFAAETFSLIVELGSASGAFTQFLADASGARVLSWDRQMPIWPARGGLEYLCGDVMDGDTFGAIQGAVEESGRALILCDNGNKPKEFALYAALLRRGDGIMAHDYAPTRAAFEASMKGKRWQWLEVTDADLAPAIAKAGLLPYYHDIFAAAAWGSFWRPRL